MAYEILIPALDRALYDQLALLAISGIAGSFARAVYHPEPDSRKRIAQALLGAMSAIFLGGVLAQVIYSLTGAGSYSFLFAGFVMGFGGELGVQWAQGKFMGRDE